MVHRGPVIPVLAVPILLFAGCIPSGESESSDSIAVTITPSAIRAARRAYSGAPPVIPHPPLGASCIQCHSESGQASPPLGFAPPNPHLKTPGIGKYANCRQCHLFRRADAQDFFRTNEFIGFQPAGTKGNRLYSTAPPVIPHQHFMRESCVSCHTGTAARPEIRCTHPDRVNCRQCHVNAPPVGDPHEGLFPSPFPQGSTLQ